MYVGVRACVRACGCSLVSLVYSRVFFGPKSHIKCRVRLRSFLVFLGGGGGKRIKTFSTERENDKNVIDFLLCFANIFAPSSMPYA